MAERSRDETGQYTGEVTDDDVVAAVRAHDPAATSEIGDELGVSRQAADRRLRNLRSDGRVSSKKIGASLVWFLPRETGETPSVPSDDQRVGQAAGGRTSPEYAAEETDAPDPIGDALGGWDPDTETAVEAARTQTRRAAEWLRSTGDRHTKSDFQAALADDSALTPRIWWERAVQPGLRRLAEDDLVEYRSGYHDYRWIGPDTDA